MIYLISAVASVLSVEVLIRTGLAPRVARMMALSGKAAQVVRSSRISDHWKERVLPRYAGGLFVSTLWLGCYLILFLSPFGGAVALGRAFDVNVAGFLASATGIIGVSLFALLYAIARNRFVRRRSL